VNNGAQNNSDLYGRIRSNRQAQTRPVNARRFSGDVVTSRPQVVLNIPASVLPTSIDQPRPVQQVRSAIVPQQQVAPAPAPAPMPAPAPQQPQAQPQPQYQPQPAPQPQVPPVTVFAPPVEQPPAPPQVQYQPAPPVPAPPQPVAAPVPVQNPTPAPVAAAPVEAVLYNPIPQVPEMELVPEPVQVPTQEQYPVHIVPETSFAQAPAAPTQVVAAQPISQEPVIEQGTSMQYEYDDQYGAEDEADPAVKPVVWEKPVKNPELKMKLNRALTLGLMMAQTAFQAPVDAGKEVYRKLRGGEYSNSQVALTSMALLVFIIGVFTSIQTIRTNHATSAQVAALVSQSQSQETAVNTIKADGTKTSTSAAAVVPDPSLPNAQTISSYTVGPSEPRYIKIPSLGVNARVRQVGMLSNGELGVPKNVHDAAWYGASAKPGQPGATLIDGHVSNWTTHGVFYDIKSMAPGDAINIERGDGGTVMYKVVKVLTYDADKVDMQAAVTPVTDGKSGLNLITCAGSVKPGTNEYDKRVIVFAEQK